jgi:maltose O-acetyltransferase
MSTRFNSLTKELISQRKAVHELCRQFTRSPSNGNLKRLKALFAQCGESVIIEAGFHMDYGTHVVLGDRVYINANCTVLDGLMSEPLISTDKEEIVNSVSSNNSICSPRQVSISIGDDCLIGPNVQLLAVSHDINPTLRQAHKYNYTAPITLGKNVWLGGGVIVLGGVNIGENSVIGAGSVVTKNIDANGVYAGNPARKIREL